MEKKDKRFIEDTFPIREVSIEGSKEKNIRQGHISTLHIWWARRPLATSRATNFASLIPVPETEEEKQKLRQFISEISKWENSNNETLLNKARKMILVANHGIPPKVLDPYGGGGSIPLEALRLGCETYSNDYNPVAVLIQKCTLEYPQKFGRLKSIEQYKKERPWLEKDVDQHINLADPQKNGLFINEPQADYQKLVNPLFEDVKYWGDWVINEAQKDIGKFYPDDPDGATVVGYIWARTIHCQNPTCNAEIPLMKQYWLVNKENKQVVISPSAKKGRVEFKIIGGDYHNVDPNFNPDEGTVSRATVTCPVCGSVIDEKITRKLFQQGKTSQKMIAVVTTNDKLIEIKNDAYEISKKLFNGEVPSEIIKALRDEGFKVNEKYFSLANKSAKSFLLVYNDNSYYTEFKVLLNKGKVLIEVQGKAYRLAIVSDIEVFEKAERYLEKKREQLLDEWGIDPIPDEEIPLMSGVFNVPIYGINKWGKLFNNRQILSSVVLLEKIKQIENAFISNDNDLKVAMQTFISFVLCSVVDHNSNLGQWRGGTEDGSHVFGRQALPMTWDYFEVNIFSGSTGSYYSALSKIGKVINNLSLGTSTIPPKITNLSATQLGYKSDYFDAIFTDPPYYNSVPYADLSDFFYVWHKRTLGDKMPELFSTPLSPKANEITEMSGWDSVRYSFKDKQFFEDNLKRSFQEIYRILKPNGIATIVYAHKSTEGWETVLNALLDSGLVITGSYPLNTEMQVRLRANDSATLSSSIYIIARKLKREGTGFYNEVKEELRSYLNTKLDQLWGEGIVGADFFIAAIGSAIEVFGKYDKVMDYEGNIKRADVLLDDVREFVMNYTIGHILQNGFSGEVTDLTRFYVLYRFSYGEAKLEFDEANKLARSVGIDLTQEFNKDGFIKKDKEFVRVLTANNRKIEDLKDKNELIDVLHHSILLWESGKKERMMELLAETGFGKSEAFFRVAQAISESLAKTSPDSREKKLLDGFLGGKERIKSEITNTKVSKKNIQGKLEF